MIRTGSPSYHPPACFARRIGRLAHTKTAPAVANKTNGAASSATAEAPSTDDEQHHDDAAGQHPDAVAAQER